MDTPKYARGEGPRDLEFQDGENNFNQASSRFTAMRLLQAVRAARLMAQTQLHVGRTGRGTPRHGQGPPYILLETAYAEAYNCLKPRLE